MDPKFSTFANLLMVAAAVLVVGCSTGPRVKVSDAALSGNPNAMWADGKKSAETGEALVEKGEKRLAQGRDQVRRGQAKISAGNAVVAKARDEYEAAASTVGNSSTPVQVSAEARRLRAIGGRWEKGIDEIREGNQLVDLGNRNIDQGQAEIREGRTLMESGSTMMRNAARMRLGVEQLPSADHS